MAAYYMKKYIVSLSVIESVIRLLAVLYIYKIVYDFIELIRK